VEYETRISDLQRDFTRKVEDLKEAKAVADKNLNDAFHKLTLVKVSCMFVHCVWFV
jgi:hypothetical protein